jgi:predicted CoA-binding protein
MSEQQMPDMYARLQLLRQYHHIAVVGVSADPYRPSHFVAIYLQAAGYTITPINPRYAGQTLLGRPVYGSLTAAKNAGEQIEIVDVFRKEQDIPPIADEAIAIGAKVLWVQLGLHSAEAAHKAVGAGLSYIEDRCIKIEHARFFGGLHTIGLNTGVILSKKL